MDDYSNTDVTLERAEALVREGRYEEAIVLYRELVRSHPGEDSYLLALAWVCHDGGYSAEALKCFRELFERELSSRVFSGFAFDELVRIYKEKGDWARLVDVCERAVKAQADDFALLGDLGDAYQRTGRYADAIGIFQKMIDMEPDASAVYCSLGNACVAAGALHQARDAYARAVAIEPEKREVFLCRLSDVLLKAGHAASAEALLRECLEGNRNPLLRLDLADLLISMGRVGDAEQMLNEAVELNPPSEGIFCNRLGNSLARAGHHETAIAYFKRAIESDPRNPFYFMHLSASCTAIGREDIAAAMFRGNDLP
ncbi:MAG TPA: tetratricopeptide repeat protein [Syntrophales bacterium]|nr:tetratricopeptide repeat protein [Syntrophales bacterium]